MTRLGAMYKLVLEERFDATASGRHINMVADLITFRPGAHVFQSVIHKQLFLCDGLLQQQTGRFTIFNGSLAKIQGKFWIQTDSATTVIEHPKQGVVAPIRAIEVCAGIGAMGQGLSGCNVTTDCYVGYNPRFCQWLRDHGHLGVLEGNIADTRTVVDAHKIAPKAQLMVGGVACQPFSRLGDRKEQDDPRSESFPAFLRMLFWLQIPIGIMECTSEVLDSSWAQGMLGAFMDATGSVCTQKILHLHRLWPSYRTRWWAVITQQGIPAMVLDDLPEIPFTPGIVHLIPKMLEVPPNELSQIELDPYELRAFHSCKKGVQSCIVEKCRPMATATHSWGSQVTGCSCGCRTSGFSFERLHSQGLHGAVCVLPGYQKINGEEVSKLRHLHPQEVSLLCGLKPSWVEPNPLVPLRLDLAGVGQLASPLQSNWILTQVLSHLQRCGKFDDHDDYSPKKRLFVLIQSLFQERDSKWQVVSPTRYMKIFHTAVHQALHSQTDDSDDPDFNQALLKSVQHAELDLQGENNTAVDPVTSEEVLDRCDDFTLANFFHAKLEERVESDPYEICSVDDHSVNVVTPFAQGGGHPGFQSGVGKRSLGENSDQENKKVKSQVFVADTEFASTSGQDNGFGILEDTTGLLVAPDGWACQSDRCYQSGGHEEDGGPSEDPKLAVDACNQSTRIQIHKEGMPYPGITKVSVPRTIQQIIDAESNLGPSDSSIVARDAVGQVLPPTREVTPASTHSH